MSIKLMIDRCNLWEKQVGPGEALVISKIGALHPSSEDDYIVKVSISKAQMMALVSDALDQNGIIEIRFEDIAIITRGGRNG